MKRVYASQYGLLAGHVLGRAPWSIPATLKILFDGGSIACPDEDLYGASFDGRLWAFESGIYRWTHRIGVPDTMDLVVPGDLRLVGPNWAMTDDYVVISDGLHGKALAHPIPDMLRSEDYNETWVSATDDTDMMQFVPACRYVGGIVLGRWGIITAPFRYLWESPEHRALRKYIESSKSAEERAALLKRLALLSAEERGDLANGDGVYTVAWYDCYPRLKTAVASTGGCWKEDGALYAHGLKTAGRAKVVPAIFDSDGTCLGAAFVHSGALQASDEGYFTPVRGGVVHVGKRTGSMMGSLLPCGGTWTKRIWEEGSTVAAPLLTDAYVSSLWGYLSSPVFVLAKAPKYLATMEPVSETVSPVMYGGTGETVWAWCAPGGSTIADMMGHLLAAIGPNGQENILTDFRSMRRHLMPGIVCDILPAGDGARIVSHFAKDDGTAHRITSPLAVVPDGERFSQEIAEADIIVPWRAYAGEILDIGWWNWSELDIKGGIPNLGGLGNKTGGDDLKELNVSSNRRSFTVTSDGYVYATFQTLANHPVGREAVGVAAFFYDRHGWRKTTTLWDVPDVRVAPFGQGCYSTYHYPGANWSLFFAPCGDVQYRRFYESTDWSFLLGLVGLAGGDSLYGAYLAQQAFEKYLEESFGNMMLIYTNPKHRIILGDPTFARTMDVVDCDGGFWSFVGWTTEGGEPEAVFSRAAAGEAGLDVGVWCIGRSGKRRVDAESLGAIGAAALATVPANYYPRIGLWPGAPAWQQQFLGGSDYYYFDLPEGSGSVGNTLAETVVERLRAWQGKERDIGKDESVAGQVTNHQVFSTAAVDPMVPIMDARLMKRDGRTWCMLRHETGIWLGVRCVDEYERFSLENATDWELVSLGLRDDGSVVALFGSGVCSFEFGDSDEALEIFGMAQWWKRYSLYKWYARLLPIVVLVDPEGMGLLKDLWKQEGE